MLDTTMQCTDFLCHACSKSHSLTVLEARWTKKSNQYPRRRDIIREFYLCITSHHFMTIVSPCARSRSSGLGSKANPISRSSFCY